MIQMFVNSVIHLLAVIMAALITSTTGVSVDEAGLAMTNVTTAPDADPNELLATLYTDRYCPDKDWNPIYRYDYEQNGCWILDASGHSGWIAIKMHVRGHFFTGQHCGVVSAGDPPKIDDCVHFVDFAHISGIRPE